MTLRRAVTGTLAVVVIAQAARAQQYRVRVDAQAQAIAFRGLVADSIQASQVVISSSGGSETPDGYAVRCGAGNYCYFMRPSGIRRGVPAVTSANVVMWGFGVDALSLRTTARAVADLSGDRVWPGTNPAVQLIEGYLDYQRGGVIARAGRQLVASRLEPIGFDGGSVRVRWDSAALEFMGYAGWGLGQAAALPMTSPALNPLDEWRPRDRQVVAGIEASWQYRANDVRAEYRREVDPRDNYFVSERAAASFASRFGATRIAGGVDYNIAEGHTGSAELTATYLHTRFSASAGVRRYRPYFSLWTLWGAFSPVGYDAVRGSARVRMSQSLSMEVHGERYQYEDAGVSTALVPELEDRGWRAGVGATATLDPRWTIDANYQLEHGPGAAGRFADAAIAFAASPKYHFDLYGGVMARPLELRYYDATSRWLGGRAEWQVDVQRRVWGDIALVDDDRDRPDAGASSMTQVRVRAGLSVAFGSSADRIPLPPAVRTGR